MPKSDIVDIAFPAGTEKYVDIQCNKDLQLYTNMPENKVLEKHLRNFTPQVALDVGCGIGRASVYFFKRYGWNNTTFILADGDSGDKQLNGIRDGKGEYYNSLNATRLFCKANGMRNYKMFNLEKLGWGDLPGNPGFVYSMACLGFHWPIFPFLNDVYSRLANDCLLFFGIRGRESKVWIGEQVERIDRNKYDIIELVFAPKWTKHGRLILRKRQVS